jgi:hypothetical protein
LISPQDYGVTLASRLEARKEVCRPIMHREMHADPRVARPGRDHEAVDLGNFRTSTMHALVR